MFVSPHHRQEVWLQLNWPHAQFHFAWITISGFLSNSVWFVLLLCYPHTNTNREIRTYAHRLDSNLFLAELRIFSHAHDDSWKVSSVHNHQIVCQICHAPSVGKPCSVLLKRGWGPAGRQALSHRWQCLCTRPTIAHQATNSNSLQLQQNPQHRHPLRSSSIPYHMHRPPTVPSHCHMIRFEETWNS